MRKLENNRGEILIISNYFAPEIGAAPRRIAAMAYSFQRNGYSTRVVCPLPNYPSGSLFKGYRFKWKVKEEINGIAVDRLFIYPSKSKNGLIRALSMLSFSLSLFFYLPFIKISNVKFVLIQSPPLFVSFTAVFLSKWILRKKIFLNVSDLWPLSAVELGVLKPGPMMKLLTALESYIYKESDRIIGQSNEIIDHISKKVTKPFFVYRNLPQESIGNFEKEYNSQKKKLVYAGLLGYAQGVLNICKNVDFNSLDLEFHVYGMGMEEMAIASFCRENPSSNVTFHGAFQPNELSSLLKDACAAIVPLANRIQGAVPSKIFELIDHETPIVFSGGGEGASIIDEYGLGFTVVPGDMAELNKALKKVSEFSTEDYNKILYNIKKVKKEAFNFQIQFDSLLKFIEQP